MARKQDKSVPAGDAVSQSAGATEAVALTGGDILRRAADTAGGWRMTIDAVLEYARHGGDTPLPGWAVSMLMRATPSFSEHQRWMGLAHHVLSLAEGRRIGFFYEVWRPNGERLDGRYEYRQHADEALERLRPRFPDAFITYTSAAFCCPPATPELLPTLIGKIRWCGVTLGHGRAPEQHILQDETGRILEATAKQIRAHPTVMAGLSDEACDRITNDKSANHA